MSLNVAMFRLMDSCRKVTYLRRSFCMSAFSMCEEKKKPKRKVSENVELVTLVDQNDKILGLKPKPETEKLARKLNLTLERVYDTRYGKTHPAYKLVSSADIMKVVPTSSSARTLKRLPINCRIADHDLVIKIKIVQKWLEKGCEVHVAITGNSSTKTLMKTLFEKMQEHLKEESNILDVRRKEDALKFIIHPAKKASSKMPENSTVNEVEKTDT